MARAKVRSYTRRTKDGRTIRVSEHGRSHSSNAMVARRGKGLFKARRAFRNIGRGLKALNRERGAVGVTLLVAGVAELAVWATLRGVTLAAGAVAVLSFGLASLAHLASRAADR